MHSFLYILCLLASLTPALAAPQVNTQTCQNEGVLTWDNFNVSPNVYAGSTGTGSQCSQINSNSGSALAWSTTWAWQNIASENQAWNWIKSYAYGTTIQGVSFAILSRLIPSIKIQFKERYADLETVHSL